MASERRAENRQGTRASVVKVIKQLVDLAVEKPQGGVEGTAGTRGNRLVGTGAKPAGIADRLGQLRRVRGRTGTGLELLAGAHVEFDRYVVERQLRAEGVE